MATANAEQNAAMAAQNSEKTRKGPYFTAFNTAVEQIDTRIKAWTEDQKVDGSVRDAVVEALSSLRTWGVEQRDLDRGTDNEPGKHYVGVSRDGKRSHFKSVAVPSADGKGFEQYARVLGPFHREEGALHVVKYNFKPSTPTVFLRGAK